MRKLSRPVLDIALKVFIFGAICDKCNVVAARRKTRFHSTNPGGGGAFNSPVITTEGYFVVGSDLGGLYLSKNNGKSWYPVGKNRGLLATHIASLASHPSRLLIGTDNGFFYATTDGTNVEVASINDVDKSGYISAICVSPVDPNFVYAARHPEHNALNANILKSTDGGQSWEVISSSNFPNDARVVGMKCHPSKHEKVWAITGEGRFAESSPLALFSNDGGKTWIDNDPIVGMVVDVAYTADGTNVYATVEKEGEGYLLISTDDGRNWGEVASSRTGAGPGGLSGVILMDASNKNHIRLIDFNIRSDTPNTLFWETFDSGKTWTKKSNSVVGGWSQSDEDWGMGYSFQGMQQTIGYNLDNPNFILWANTQFVYASSTPGQMWYDVVSDAYGSERFSSRKIDNVVPAIVDVNNADSFNLIYAGYFDLGIWRSRDGGSTWKSLNPGTKWSHNWGGKGGNTLSVVSDPKRANVVWAQVAGDLTDPLHLVRSYDYGETWTELTNGLPSNKRHIESIELALDSTIGNRWLYVVANGDVYLSENDGNSWKNVLTCGDCVGVRYTKNTGVFAFGPSNVWRSWQGGKSGTWNTVQIDNTGWTQGQHWLDNQWTYVGPVDIAANNSPGNNNGFVWIAVKGKGVYLSLTYGSSFQKMVYNHPDVRSVHVDSTKGQVLVGISSALMAGGYDSASMGLVTSEQGLSSNGWETSNNGLAWPFVTFVITTPEKGTQWIISPGQGIMKRRSVICRDKNIRYGKRKRNCRFIKRKKLCDRQWRRKSVGKYWCPKSCGRCQNKLKRESMVRRNRTVDL